MTLDSNEIIAEATRLLAHHQRKALLLTTSAQTVECQSNHLLGSAVIPEGEQWPACGYCGRQMTLLLQVSSNLLSQVLPGFDKDQLLQVFCCFDLGDLAPEAQDPDNQPCCDRAWNEPGKDKLVRLIPKTPNSVCGTPPVNWTRKKFSYQNPNRVLPSTQIIKAEKIVPDMPMLVEAVELIDRKIDWITLFDASTEWSIRNEGECPPCLHNNKHFKIGGWPTWMNNPDIPSCPVCNKKMRYITQVKIEEDLGFEAAVPWVHVFYCQNHSNKFTLVYENT